MNFIWDLKIHQFLFIIINITSISVIHFALEYPGIVLKSLLGEHLAEYICSGKTHHTVSGFFSQFGNYTDAGKHMAL